MPLFRKKPIIIEARQYTRNGLEAEKVAEWCEGDQNDYGVTIHTPEGEMLGEYGDWIIKGVRGEFYPCKPGIFKETYEEVQ